MNQGDFKVRPIVIVSANSCWNLVNFRASILRVLVDHDCRVVAAAPLDSARDQLLSMGVEIEPVSVDSLGLSPFRDAALCLQYIRLFRRTRPTAFLGFTAKPNIFGSIAARLTGIPAINTITGLGTAFLSGRALERLVSILYRTALGGSSRVFFHNSDDRDLFVAHRLVRPDQTAVVAGSGIDLEYFSPSANPPVGQPLTFLFVGRLLKDKGVNEFVEAAAIVGQSVPARFQLLGALEDHPKAVAAVDLQPRIDDSTVELLGTTTDVRPFIGNADCIVLPSYREGLPRVLLEASAMAKPVIASDVPGCRQAVENEVTGLLCRVRSAQSLADAMLVVAAMTPEQRAAMGRRGRQKAEAEFSSEQVAAAYVEALDEIARG
ncbi:MAG TPA: glycosyltransferase family 4 protein [Sphingomicrobium sp.]|nr:glycosyltransferase family 4 protein [Sphingomicrobium sp.]